MRCWSDFPNTGGRACEEGRLCRKELARRASVWKVDGMQPVMEVISRKEAKARGLKRYFTGKPCKHGHVSERYTGSGACVECNATPERKAYNARNARNARNATPERKAYKAAYMASYNATPERKVLNTARNTARNAKSETLPTNPAHKTPLL